jgi:hypothetical protein
MNSLPFISGRLEVEQQIGAFPFQIRIERHATRYLSVSGVSFRPRVPSLNDGQFCGVIVSCHALAFLSWLSHPQAVFNSRMTSSKSSTQSQNGGLPAKTLSLIMGGIHVGKTHFMCHCAAANMIDGKNVLYITLEISEEEIARRIDANLLDWPINELKEMPRDLYDSKVARVRNKTPGKLIIKEYPTGSANVNHFRHVLHELRFKKKFRPDVNVGAIHNTAYWTAAKDPIVIKAHPTPHCGVVDVEINR